MESNTPREPGRAPDRPDIKPLSPTATKILVLAAVILAFALAIGGALYLIDVAEESQPEVPTEQTPSDTLN